MYGNLLLPFLKKHHAHDLNVKFLEIGIGCGMAYGAMVGADLWLSILKPSDELWEGADPNPLFHIC